MIKQVIKRFYYTKIKKWDAAQIRLNHLRKTGKERVFIIKRAQV